MRLEDLLEYFGTYSNMARKLELGYTTYLGWRKKGFIPYQTQCRIEVLTNYKFKANKKHEKIKD